MHRPTALITTATAAAAVAVAGLTYTLWPDAGPGTDPRHWPTETLSEHPGLTLPHLTHLAPSGCPAFTVSSPVVLDGVGDGYQMRLAPAHFAFVACIGSSSEGDARQIVADRIAALGQDGSMSATPTLVRAPFGEAVRLDTVLDRGSPPTLTDWFVDHDGYVYEFGYGHPADDMSHLAEVEVMISSLSFEPS